MITVYGLFGSPSMELRVAAATADKVVGGHRQLDSLDVEPERRITLGALAPAVAEVASMPPTSQVVVVASGDPGYFGVVRKLRAAGLRPEVVSAPSSIAAAFAGVGVPWDDAVVVSVHGRPLEPALNLAQSFAKVGVFTSAEHGIRELARGLDGLDRWFVLAERLGEPEQSIRVLTAEEAQEIQPAEPNVVLILAATPEDDDRPWAGSIGLPDRPSRPEVSAAAAVAFARLLPTPGELLWVAGPLADEVASLARWAGAAVTTTRPGQQPDAILSNHVVVLEACSPRALVLTGPAPGLLPEGYRWWSETIDNHELTTGVRR